MFSNPKELLMDINITFPNKQMLESFLKSFKKLGYRDKNFGIIGNTFCFNILNLVHVKYGQKTGLQIW